MGEFSEKGCNKLCIKQIKRQIFKYEVVEICFQPSTVCCSAQAAMLEVQRVHLADKKPFIYHINDLAASWL
jgi:hypothetical protein